MILSKQVFKQVCQNTSFENNFSFDQLQQCTGKGALQNTSQSMLYIHSMFRAHCAWMWVSGILLFKFCYFFFRKSYWKHQQTALLWMHNTAVGKWSYGSFLHIKTYKIQIYCWTEKKKLKTPAYQSDHSYPRVTLDLCCWLLFL